MRRYLPSIAGASTALLFVFVAGGAEGSLFLPLLLVLPVVLLVSWWARRGGDGGDVTWSGDEVFDFVPSARHEPCGVGGVALALGRVEAREFAASASFGVGLGFSCLIVFLFGFEWFEDSGGDLLTFLSLLAIFAHPLVGMTMFAAFRARTRARRDGVEELFGSCPTSQTTRSAAHLTTAWVAVLAALGMAALLVLCFATRSAVVVGDVGGRQVADVAVLAVLAVGAVALGVLLARLLPWTVVPVVVLVMLGFATARLASNGIATNGMRQLSTWIGDTGIDVRFTAPHYVAHVLWLLGLTALVIVLATLRDLRRPVVLGVGAVVVVATAAAGWAATRPIDPPDARRIAAMLVDPAEAQECAETGPVSVCSFAPERELRDRYLEAVAPVAAAVPAAFDPVVIRYAAQLDTEELDPEVLALLPDEAAEPGLIPLEMIGHHDAYEAARVWVGLAATGVLEGRRPGSTADLRGQARGALALWLATRGAAPGTVASLTSFDPRPGPGDVEHRPWPGPCAAGIAPVVWAEPDVAAARALTELPEDEVVAVLAADWERWVDPSTTTAELAEALGIEPTGDPAAATRLTDC